MKIKIDQLIAVLGKEKADSFFLNPDWIKKQKRYHVMDVRYLVWEQFGRLEDRGHGNYEGDLNFHGFSPEILKYLPKINTLIGDFDCSMNGLTTLEGCPRYVVGGFSCNENNLSSLEGSPEEVFGYFNCSFNQIENLRGSPKRVNGSFFCNSNSLLTSLRGSPEFIGGKFICINNLQVKDLEGISQEIKGDIILDGSTVFDLYEIERTPDGKTYRLSGLK